MGKQHDKDAKQNTSSQPQTGSENRDDVSTFQLRSSFKQALIKLGILDLEKLEEAKRSFDQLIQKRDQDKSKSDSYFEAFLVKQGYLKSQELAKVKDFEKVASVYKAIPGYKIVRLLGSGAMGSVYQAWQVQLERWVAIKILKPELARRPELKERFLIEARAAARLNHPNVIAGIDAGEIDGLCYFIMEFVEGQSVGEILRKRGPIAEKQALQIVYQVAQALEHAENHRLVHRDIKPDNIMVNRNKTAKLLDLGLAKIGLASRDTNKTTPGTAVGTPNYIAPEQALGKTEIDTRSDIYSLGATLFKMLTGQTPFQGKMEAVMYQHVHEPLPDPREFYPDLSEGVVKLLYAMMEKDPCDRPESAKKLVSWIKSILEPEVQKAPAAGEASPKSFGRGRAKKKPGKRKFLREVSQQRHGAESGQRTTEDEAYRMPRKRRRRFNKNW